MKLIKRPDFNAMSVNETHDYLLQYIKEKFSPNSRFMVKIPESYKEDALHEIFIDLWNNRFNYSPKIADYTTYAYNRGRHVIKMVLAQVIKTKRIQDRIKERPLQKQKPISIVDRIKNDDDLREISLRLTDHEKEVIKMRFYENKSVGEIAKNKNCSPQKIYQTISGLKKYAIT